MEKNEWLHFSKRENELLTLLWDVGKPMTVSELCEYDRERSWTDRYLRVMINSLLERRVLYVAGYTHVGEKRTITRQFAPSISQEEYFAVLISACMKRKKIPNLFMALAKRNEISPETFAELEKMIEDFRNTEEP